ncbi:MAG TPA: AmmeMemoRadiSam system protein B [Elusimicrobiota bacterium]|nr:AmmeMemoRadiSam system protein B [Elusimicrobiota bacterium]
MKRIPAIFCLTVWGAGLWAGEARPPAVAGQFYPSSPGALKETVDALLSKAPSHELRGDVVALWVPHAGYVYSGAVAAEAFKCLSKEVRTVVLLGPSHHVWVKSAAVYGEGRFKTPLGEVDVDEELAGRLLGLSPLFERLPSAHAREHSLEVQLPFLQRGLSKFKILPILTNVEDPAQARRLGAALAEALRGRKAVLVISSDLSHYPTREVARRADETFLRAAGRMDPEYLRLTSQVTLGRGEEQLQTTACGQGALMTGICAAKALGADSLRVLRYVNSGEIPEIGDPNRAVGYAAAVFVNAGTAVPREFVLKPADKAALLSAARRSIGKALDGGAYAPEAMAENAELNLPAAVFVTLQERGRLRGCIGTTTPQSSLWEGVRYFARAAAFDDPRFPPVQKGELDELHIEISVLSVPERVKDASVVQPGRHGVIVRRKDRMGLFLPTVWEQLPDKAMFLSELCSQKAGLPEDCWEDPEVELSVFTTDVFEEPKRP